MKKRNFKAILFLPLFMTMFLWGCATPLSNKGSLVRVTNQKNEVEVCKYLGQVTSSSGWGGYAATGVGFESVESGTRERK
jgi:hypothetical protein